MKTILLTALLSGPGAGIVLLILMRIMPKEKFLAACEALGRLISTKGRGKVGKKFWEPIETFAQERITEGVVYLCKGLDHDDANGNGKAGGK